MNKSQENTSNQVKAIKSAQSAIKKNPNNHLPLKNRKKIWLAYGPIDTNEENIAVQNEGYFKRVQLAIDTCKKVLPIWEKYIGINGIPHKALDYANQYLSKNLNADELQELANNLLAGLENTQNLSNDQLNAVLVGYACVDMLLTLIGDCYCEDLDDDDEDLDIWDTSMYAAGAFSGGYPWQDSPFQSSPIKLGEFWQWYIDHAATL